MNKQEKKELLKETTHKGKTEELGKEFDRGWQGSKIIQRKTYQQKFEWIELEIAKILNHAKDAKVLEDLLSDISLYIDQEFGRDEITGYIKSKLPSVKIG